MQKVPEFYCGYFGWCSVDVCRIVYCVCVLLPGYFMDGILIGCDNTLYVGQSSGFTAL